MDLLSKSFSRELTIGWYQELAVRAMRLSETSSISEPDVRRYTVLKAACRHQDIFFLAIHQLCCLWSIDRAAVYEIFDPFTNLDDIDSTLDSLQQILNNENLPPYTLQWFANFPQPIKEALTSFEGMTFTTHLASFMERFSTLWHSLLSQSEAQGGPIAGSVLRNHLHCSSPLLRYILFVTSSLHIGIVAGPDATILDDQFEKDEDNKGTPFGQSVRGVLASEYVRLLDYHI